MKPHRPWIVGLLATGFLIFAADGFIRFGEALANWQVLTAAGMRPGPIYPALTGAVYGLSGVWAALSLWFALPRAARLGRGLILFYAAWFWIDKLIIAQNPADRANWLVPLVFTVLYLLIVFGTLELHRVQQYLENV